MNGYSASLNKPRIEITEQPAPKALRFRYECEGRSAGSIPGEHSTPDNRTYPTVRVVGYDGKEDIVIVVSCVTKNQPYLAHPHNLVGKDCKEGICSINLDRETMTAVFSNLGIQCVKKRDIEAALKLRQSKHVDPFASGFEHMNNPSSIDLNCVRLCFQAIVKTTKPILLGRVVSNPVYDKKAMSDLLITRLSHASASARGGTDMVLLCEKITKEDIKVRFYEERQDQEVWEAFADILLVHKQVAIAFKTPPYQTQDICEKVPVYIQLFRPSDKATSEPARFYYTESGFPTGIKRPPGEGVPSKRSKLSDIPMGCSIQSLMEQPIPCPSPSTLQMSMDDVLEMLGINPSLESAISPNQAQCPASPSSPFHNPSAYNSPSVTPVPGDAGQINYVPLQSVPGTSALPGFGETWQQQPVLQTDYRTTIVGGLGGGGTFITHQQPPFTITPATIEKAFHQMEHDFNMTHRTNQSPAITEPINAYGNVLTPINNEEITANDNAASVEHMVDSSDLVRPLAPVVNNVVASNQNDAQQLCESFSNSMNISGDIDLDKFTNERFEAQFNHQN